MSLTNEYTDNIFMDEGTILDAHLRLLFRAFHYETPCTTVAALSAWFDQLFDSSTHWGVCGSKFSKHIMRAQETKQVECSFQIDVNPICSEYLSRYMYYYSRQL